MELNESQVLIIGAIATAMFGIPNIQSIFTQEIINTLLQNPSFLIIFLASLLKLTLIVLSVGWIIKLGYNIEFTYNRYYRWREDIFWNYLGTLILTGMATFIILYLILHNI